MTLKERLADEYMTVHYGNNQNNRAVKAAYLAAWDAATEYAAKQATILCYDCNDEEEPGEFEARGWTFSETTGGVKINPQSILDGKTVEA